MARPLTKLKDGVPYARPPDVEADIDSLLGIDPLEFAKRLRIADKKMPGYIRSECLVHFVRDAHRNGVGERRDDILRILLERCQAILLKTVSNRLPNAEAIRDDTLSDFSELLVIDGTGQNSNELDFYECKFELAFRTLRIDAITRETVTVNRNASLDSEDADEPEADEEVFARVFEAFRSPETQLSAVFLDDLLTAIDALPSEERWAVVLVHVLGLEEESENTNKVTAASLCQCTGRTIRNRLSRAAEKLARFKETT